MELCSGKITDIIRLQKNTSGDLCDIQEKVGQMLEEVDKTVEDQVMLKISSAASEL